MVFILVSFFFFAAPIQFQNKYDYCKSLNFEAKDGYCDTQKALYILGSKDE